MYTLLIYLLNMRDSKSYLLVLWTVDLGRVGYNGWQEFCCVLARVGMRWVSRAVRYLVKPQWRAVCQGHKCYFEIPPTKHLHVAFCENYTVCSVNVYITPLYVCTSHLCKVFTHSTLHTVHSGYPQHTTHYSRYLNTAHYTVSSVYTQHTTHCV